MAMNKCFLTFNFSLHIVLVGIIMEEFLVSKEGLGYLIMYGSQVFNLNLVIAGVILLCILLLLLCIILFSILKRDLQNRSLLLVNN